ncbi:hypothetical protein CC79DRAFT_1365416 [Sarocladium strictum]
MSTAVKEQLMAAASAGDVAQLQEFSPFRKHDISAADVQEVLGTAINATQTAVVEFLFTEFPEVQANDYAVRAAARAGSIPILSQLQARDPSVATRQFERYTWSTPRGLRCSGSAAYFGKEDSLKYLLEKGGKPDTDAQKIGSWTSGDHPLHSALSGGYLGTARLLLDHGSSIEAVDRNGKSIAEITAHLEARGHDRTEFTALLSQIAKTRR